MASDNPKALAQIIIDDLNGTITRRFDSKIEMYYLETLKSPTKSIFSIFTDHEEVTSPELKQ